MSVPSVIRNERGSDEAHVLTLNNGLRFAKKPANIIVSRCTAPKDVQMAAHVIKLNTGHFLLKTRHISMFRGILSRKKLLYQQTIITVM